MEKTNISFVEVLKDRSINTGADLARAFSNVFNTAVVMNMTIERHGITPRIDFAPLLREYPAAKAITAINEAMTKNGIEGIELQENKLLGGTMIELKFPKDSKEDAHALLETFTKRADVSAIIDQAAAETAAAERREETSLGKLASRMWHLGPIRGIRDHLWVINNPK